MTATEHASHQAGLSSSGPSAPPAPLTTCCTIVPPHVLDALAQHDDEALAGPARRTLERDAQLRTSRRTATLTAAAAPAGEPPAGAAAKVNRAIHDARHGTDLPGPEVRGEGDRASDDASVNRAYSGLGATFELYQKAYGRNSIDGRGLALVASVHYDREYNNAFWNGEQMVFGDGDGEVFVDFTLPVDVIGHELTHGVTQHTANLAYSGQSGALNESVSDVFGSLIKQYSLGQSADEADWLIGEGLLAPRVSGKALRSMKAPGTAYDDDVLGKDPQPATMDGYVDTTDDNGGVHINSGIPNHAFYLLATELGGNAWEKAGQIWYDVLTGGDLAENAGFAAFARLTVTAAAGRFGGTGSAEARAVVKAWNEVGVSSS
ncbi:M4 family metallopeptidase [Streptomyces sp. TS71-3]|uniref:M4 family metallopeptidase n=1 Tax=Streptomyces sp. TS71-3 TaxID=2733862 RepID=UPI001B1DD57B|nr:M4 family metallopeptidase [Streptomyces sp. TS71-3]GHJ37705.1 metalloprotease [Streptomyces sp. TS71-3]